MKKYFNAILLILVVGILSSCSVKANDNVLRISEPEELITIKVDTKGKDLPDSKDEGELPVVVRFESGKEKFKTDATIKVQGTSTSRWPKKNWRFNFYKNKNLENKVKLQIGDSVVSDKWIAKAEWVDPSMLRNAVSYQLWDSMVQSRNIEPKLEVEYGNLDKEINLQERAQGFPKTYPAKVILNGEHYGIAILMLGHEPENFNIDKNNPKHMYMEFDARFGEPKEPTWKKFKADGIGEWINGYYPKNENFSSEQISAIERLGEFINSDLDTFKNKFDNHLDKTNMIDMLLFLEMIYDHDAVSQDIEIVTYDLEKWYFLPWDKDTTFGMDWSGKGIREESYSELLFDYELEKGPYIPWFKTYQSFKDEVENRYYELRYEGIFSVENIITLVKNIEDKIDDQLWTMEKQRWEKEKRPSVNEATSEQLINWFENRLELLDSHFNYKE